MLLYRFIWVSLAFVSRVFFRKVYLRNTKAAEKGGAAIIGANHPNSFLDSVVAAIFQFRTWHFLARGDVFKGKIVKQLLSWIRMLPIYRRVDAKNNNEKNLITFDIVADITKKKGLVLIFPEGYCVIEKRLRPISKGTARMAIHACERYGWDMGLEIIPAGLNYTHPFGIRGDMYYNFGEPIKLADYKEQYLEEPNKVVVKITEELEKRMKACVIHVNHGLDGTAEKLFEIYRNDRIVSWLPIVEKEGFSPFDTEKAIADKLNHWQENDPDELASFESELEEYRAALEANKVKDKLCSERKRSTLPNYLYLLFMLPLWIYGYITNFFVFKFARSYPKKLIKSNVFYSSLRIGLIMVGYWIYFGLILIVLGLLFSFPIAIGYLVFHVFAGLSFAFAYEAFRNIRDLRRNSISDEKLQALKSMRQKIKSHLDLSI